MVGPRGMFPRILRTVYLLGLLTALWIVAPAAAVARPYSIDPGPGSESGDPTADDQPSPTPKPKAKYIGTARVQATTVATGHGRIVTVRVPWDLYLRLLAQTWVR